VTTTINTQTEPQRPFWRQGDVYFVQLDKDPGLGDAKPLKAGIIARGETTGHMHRVAPSSLADGALLSTLNGSMFLRSPAAGATILHDEHGPIALPAGTYAVLIQREFNGLGWRAVLD
jgi:hypothetical protein